MNKKDLSFFIAVQIVISLGSAGSAGSVVPRSAVSQTN